MEAVLRDVAAWFSANPLTEKALWFVAMYLVYNVIPRIPEPSDKTSIAHVLWETMERAAFLTGDRWGGSFKALFAPSPKVKGDDNDAQA